MPKTPEAQFFKKLAVVGPKHRQTIANVIRLPNYDSVQVTLCVDGGTDIAPLTVAVVLKNLYAVLGIRAEVTVHLFSFLSDNIAEQHATLQAADIFWIAGAHHVPARLREALTRRNVETRVNDLAAQVRRRNHFGHMPYVGVC